MFFAGLIGFFMGFLIPAFASRFGKILPADPGLVLVMAWHKPHFPRVSDEKKIKKLKRKWQKLLFYSLLWGIAMALLYMLAFYVMTFSHFIYAAIFLFLIGMLMTVDQQYFLLPDFFTIPLLVLGITYAHFMPNTVSMTESIIGAWFGYILSTISVVIMSIFRKAEFGAGDVKMLTALGAWFGCIGLNYTLLSSFFLFFGQACLKKKKTGAYGPALGLASIFVFFYLYLK